MTIQLPSDPIGRPERLLAVCVHWDDCSVAVGSRDGVISEVWSQQPDRAAPGGAGAAPLASRDALLLMDRLLVRTGTSLADVEGLCFAKGPGAFTALRVAAGLVQGLALTLSKPVAGICSLAAMVAQDPAWQIPVAASGAAPGTAPAGEPPGPSWLQFSAIDARMGECYFAVHECRSGSHPQAVRPPAVGKPDDVVSAFDQVLTRRGMKHAGIISTAAGNAFRLSPILVRWAHESGLDPTDAAARSPTAAAVLAVAASVGAPAGGPARQALPVYVRDKIALDVAEQRAQASART